MSGGGRIVSSLTLIVAIICSPQASEAFTAPFLASSGSSSSIRISKRSIIGALRSSSSSATTAETTKIDVSIPYDAAARLSFDEWRAKYGKGEFDANRFETFKANYEAVTVANVIAAKEARELSIANGEGPAIISTGRMELNEYADMTLQEYEALQQQPTSNSNTNTKSNGSSIGSAIREAVAQIDVASTALEEASSALLQDEQALAKQLGLESVEQLEAAMDAMEGIAEDGGELVDSSQNPRRVAYQEWCQENNKIPDYATKFPIFEQNFLIMEAYCKDNGMQMKLNEFADCSEEEYLAITAAASSVEKAPVLDVPGNKDKEENVQAQIVEKKQPEETKKEVVRSQEKVEKKATIKNPLEGFKLPQIQVEFPKIPELEASESKEEMEARIKEAQEQKAKKDKELAEAFAASEKERNARQEAQRKEADRLKQQEEANAIAAAKLEAEKEAILMAKRRAFQEEANKIAREQYRRETESMQRKLQENKQNVAVKKEEPVKVVVESKQAPQKKVAQKVESKSEPQAPIVAKTETPKKAAISTKPEVPNFFSVFTAPKKTVESKKPEPTPIVAKIEKPKEVEAPISKKPEVPNFFSAFSAPKPKVESKKPEPTPIVAKIETPKEVEAPISKKPEVPNFFSAFSAPKPKVESKKPEPTPIVAKLETPKKVEAPISKKTEVSNLFSVFSAPKQKVETKKSKPAPVVAKVETPKEVKAPTSKKSDNLFSVFSAPKQKVETKKPEPIPNARLNLSDFSPSELSVPAKMDVKSKTSAPLVEKLSADKKKTKDAPQIPMNDPMTDTIKSFFGAGAKKEEVVLKSVEPPIVKEKKDVFSLFPPKSQKSEPIAKPSPKVSVETKASSFSFFGKPQKDASPETKAIAPKKVAPKKGETVPAKKAEPLSFFGSNKSSPKLEESVPSKKEPSFSLFGTSTKNVETAARSPGTIRITSGTIRITNKGQKANAAGNPKTDNIPIIRNFVQNADGTVTGKVSGSDKFQNGEIITTSAVKRGAKSGEIVRTASGSQYRLL